MCTEDRKKSVSKYPWFDLIWFLSTHSETIFHKTALNPPGNYLSDVTTTQNPYNQNISSLHFRHLLRELPSHLDTVHEVCLWLTRVLRRCSRRAHLPFLEGIPWPSPHTWCSTWVQSFPQPARPEPSLWENLSTVCISSAYPLPSSFYSGNRKKLLDEAIFWNEGTTVVRQGTAKGRHTEGL